MASGFGYQIAYAFFAWLVVIGLNLGLAFVVAKLAKTKGYSYAGFWCLSFFASFLVGIIVVLCLKPKAIEPLPQHQPYTPPDGTAYGQPFTPPQSGVAYGKPFAPPEGTDGGPSPQTAGSCPACGQPVAAGEAFCTTCGTKL